MRWRKFFRIYFFRLFLLLVLLPWLLVQAMANYVPGMAGIAGFCPFLGDSLLPLMLMVAALIFSSRQLAVGAVLTGWLVLVLKIAAFFLYRCAFMPFNRHSVKMIGMHVDHAALQAVLGTCYLWWLIPLILLFAALIAASCIAAWKIRWKDFPHRRQWYFDLILLASVSAAANFCHLIDVRLNSQLVYHGHLVTPLPVQTVDEISTGLRQNRRKIQEISPESKAILEQLKIVSDEPPASDISCFDRIIIIAEESLDLAYVGACDPQMPQGITPELDRLLQKFPHWINYYSAAQPTSWGLDALLLSRMDFDRDVKGSAPPSLFTEMGKRGFRSYYFASTYGLFADNRKLYQDLFKSQKQYFAEDWKRELNMEPHFKWGIADDELFQGVLAILRRDKPQKFIVLISTIDLHPGYTAHGKGADDPRFVHEPFLNALHSADRNLGDFLREIMADKSIYNERTLIVVTADHSATHGRNYLKRQDYSPDRIPLIFITPQAELFRKIPADQYASSIDLAPTLLHLTGATIPPSMMGRDLFEGKNVAVSRTMADVLIVNAPAVYCTIDLNEEMPKKQPERAFFEWYHSHY